MDDQQRARELLAQEYERDGITHVPDCIRREAMLTEMEHRAIRAITVALRAAPECPEGFVMVPEVMDLDMEVAFCEAWFSKRRCIDDADMQDAWAAALAASPQGVKDV